MNDALQAECRFNPNLEAVRNRIMYILVQAAYIWYKPCKGRCKRE